MTATEHTATVTSFRPDEFEVDRDGTGRLVGGRCVACGAHFFPLRDVCAACLGDLEKVRLSTEGVLYTFTVVRQSTPAFEVPYLLGYVDLPEGVRVMGQLAGTESEMVIGSPMVLEVEPLGVDEDGSELLGYRFAPADRDRPRAPVTSRQEGATND